MQIVKLTARTPLQTRKRIRTQAKKDGFTLDKLINTLLAKYLNGEVNIK